MLRKIRLILASLFFILITLIFCDFTGTVANWCRWMVHIQFLPAVMSLSTAFALHALIIVALMALTLIFGRIYCSVICPLGVLQDLIAWFGLKRKKNRYNYSPAKNWLRLSILILFVFSIAIGLSPIVGLLAPYSSYGRMASNLFAPVYQACNNFLAFIAEQTDSYAFYSTEVFIKSLPVFIIALFTFIIVGILAWRGGRSYCNTICPVGTVLGFLAQFSLFKPWIDTSKCISCTLCARNCKASCIDAKNHKIDYSRCVSCMNCLEHCRKGAIRYGRPQKTDSSAGHPGSHNKTAVPASQTLTERKDASDKTDLVATPSSRRAFIASLAAMATAPALNAQEKKASDTTTNKGKVDGSLAPIVDKDPPPRETPIAPPGSQSLAHLAAHCTSCQLCVSVCPNHVLRGSSSLSRFMLPEMSYEHGYCRPECNKCSQICPTGAILPIDLAEKSSTQIGHAVWIKKYCVVLTDGVSCGNCARHCPTGAIQMIPMDPKNPQSPQIPAINMERCIGCGACEHLCPARPHSAIYVEGHEAHRII